MNFILQSDCETPDRLGGKARALAELAGEGLPIPPWFVVAPEAALASYGDELRNELAGATDATRIQSLATGMGPNDEVRRELARHLDEHFSGDARLAVRSSASDEDGAEHSFAGQLDSYLFVAPGDVADKVAEVWRSGYGERVLAYRSEHGLKLVPTPPSVLIQKMVDAEASGVAFGADPISGRQGVVVVGAVYGLGTALVSGESDADTYHVDLTGRIIKRELADKKSSDRFDPNAEEGVSSVPVVGDAVSAAVLSDEQVIAIARLVRRAGTFFGRPQDIEWAIEDGSLYLLQSRPITTLGRIADPDGALNLWDNSNISESYSGVTTPLTYSFARGIYEEVYRQFCMILRVPKSRIEQSDLVFRRMLGLIQGRVYYNLLSWYRTLALLPGYRLNRRFMEQMMGVKEELDQELIGAETESGLGVRIKDGYHVFMTLGGLIGSHLMMSRTIDRFYDRLNRALGRPASDLEHDRPDELAAHFHELESQLLKRWDAPLINDFFAMIFFGLLGGLGKKWIGDDGIQNDLICGEGGMISAEPAMRVLAMAELIAGEKSLVDALCNAPLTSIKDEMDKNPEFEKAYQSYLEKFGDRCLEELKLESPTLVDDPLTLLRSVGHLAARQTGEESTTRKASAPQRDPRLLAEQRIRERLAGRPIRRWVLNWVLGHARARIRDRENLRFERTRLFGRVRRIFVEIGKRFYATGHLEEPRDIFFLETNEIFGFIDGTATTTDLKGLVQVRKREFEGYRAAEAPGDRFETRGAVHVGNAFAEEITDRVTEDDGELKGIGCCAGIVRGPVRVIRDPRNAFLKPGEILVAESTDPGWILLFPAAAGVLVERGSLLSHSAIVARELQIPAIVSIPGITRRLRDGDWVEMDGGSGWIRQLDDADIEVSDEK